MARADMESAHGAPIVTSGRHKAAGRVIGVNPCGYYPLSHDGGSVSVQTRGHEIQSDVPPIDSSGNGKCGTVDLASFAYRFAIRRTVPQSGIADARQFGARKTGESIPSVERGASGFAAKRPSLLRYASEGVFSWQ